MKPFQFVLIPIKVISSGAGSRVSRGIRFGSEAHEEQRRRKLDETTPALPTHFYCQIGAQLGRVYQHGARLFSGRQSSHVLLTFHWSILCRWSTPQQITSSTTTLSTVSNKQIISLKSFFPLAFYDCICIFYSFSILIHQWCFFKKHQKEPNSFIQASYAVVSVDETLLLHLLNASTKSWAVMGSSKSPFVSWRISAVDLSAIFRLKLIIAASLKTMECHLNDIGVI